MAETWEPYEARVSRTVLRGPAGVTPAGYSTIKKQESIRKTSNCNATLFKGLFS
jgi:hypothetical protein